MAATVRQPFAPLHGTRLQALTSLKNKQNAIPFQPTAGAKRKVSDFADLNNVENVDPLFTKRSKGVRGTIVQQDNVKPSSLCLATTPSAPSAVLSSVSQLLSPPPRTILHAKSPSARRVGPSPKPLALSTPAGRSPTRNKCLGLLSRHQPIDRSYRRLDPPALFLGNGATSFSLDAALKGTIQAYTSIQPVVQRMISPDLHDLNGSLTFDIHEDTPEQEMTNLLQHGTCVLDISSDEESEEKALRERAEGRDKENIPPVGDASQTIAPVATKPQHPEAMPVSDRVALAEIVFEKGLELECFENAVFIVPGDEDEKPDEDLGGLAPFSDPDHRDSALLSVHQVMAEVVTSEVAVLEPPLAKPALGEDVVLEPIEGAGDGFELWESSSAKDGDESMTALA